MVDRAQSVDALFWGETNESEALCRYRTLVNTIDDGIYQLDSDGCFVGVNEAIVELTGYSRDDLLDEHVSLVFDETDIERFENDFRRPGDGDGVSNDGTYEATIETATNDSLHCELQVNFLTSNGEFDGSIGIVRNISERNQREHRLESELNEIFERISDAFYALDEDFRFVHVNDRAAELFERPKDELLGQTVWEVFPEVRESRGFDEFSRALETGEPRTYEERFFGTWFEVNAYPSESGLSVYFRDVTDRKERERELEKTEHRYRTLVEHFPNGAVALVDTELRYTTFGGTPEGDTDVTRTDIEGSSVRDLPRNVREAVQPGYEAALNGDPSTVEETIDDRVYQFRFVPVRDDSGDIFAALGMSQDVTEQNEREQELKRYEKTIETIWDGVATLDADDRFVMVNEAFCELTGYERDDLLGEHVTLIHDETINEQAEELADNVLADKQEYASLEFDLDTASDETIPVEGRFGPYEYEDGMTGRTGVVRDITERKERERELEQYETIVETVNDGIYVVDADNRFTMVNDAYTELTGYSREELLGSHASLVVDDETIEQANATETEIVDGRADDPKLEAAVRTADGDRVPAEATFSVLPGDERRRIGVVRDITERKARERAVEESERRYRSLVENFPDGAVGLYDDDLTYTVAGGELLGDLGISPDEIVGASIYERYPDELIETIKPHFQAVFDGDARSFEVEYHDRDLFAQTLPIRNIDDEIYAGMLLVQDITERREYQRQLELSNERLEQFAYVASHDLQEPLRMVTSYLQLIDSRYGDAFDEDGEEFLDFAIDGADRMREMIDGLLEYSRIETKGETFEPVDLDSVLGTVLKDLEMRIEENDATISTDDLPRVEGDESQLRQLFQNLLSNAITYSGDEPPQVDITAERDGEYWVISVRDEGIGIDPDATDRIFEVFQRLHSQTEQPGSGIGLALCRRIVERHGGEIWVDSEPGEGTTFTFTIPADGV
ncbi:PAS domain-containing sensor histidine kinase [Natronorubrum texcoconense]|uniref:histidine kinase n=1 Tax=Natronorubrum texcoconense TaxID=1095776 RepID=A0A1G9BUT5_9EURY|nr:PAS domain S-box protein [Natronorubrum texcoconense]SDK43197.1 PAS domain S-box-containing protein [Natronorubrum texcoconense]